MIVDAHVHLPAVEHPGEYETAVRRLVDDLKRDRVERAILIPDNIPGSAIGDVPACLALTEKRAELCLMGTIDVQTQGEPWVETLAGLFARHRLVAMKLFPGHEPVYPTDERLNPVYALCQAQGAPVVIHTGWNSGHPEAAQYNDPKYILEVAERFPALRIVIAHLFWPEVDYCRAQASGCSRIYYDTSGLADREVVEATGEARIRNVLLQILEEDPRRVVFGSDYAMCDRRAHIDLIRSLPVGDDVRERVFWRNAADLFRLPEFGG